jgi:hypothetical protein
VSGLRPFVLQRDTDLSGISGTGVVAEGVEFSSGVVALTWLSEWPTSVVFHERGIDSVRAVHGHGGATRIVWTNGERSNAELEAAVDRVRRMHPRGSEDSRPLAPGRWCPGCGETRTLEGYGSCRTRGVLDGENWP